MKQVAGRARRVMGGLVAAALLTAVLPATAAAAAPGVPTLTVTPVVTGLTIPWDVAQAPDGTLLFTQREVGLSVRRTDGTVAALTADFSDLLVAGETGLMGLVLDPRFAANRRFYTCQGRLVGTVADMQVVAWTVDRGYTTATRVASPLLGGIPSSTGRHGGCRLRFDVTRALMVSTGDAAVGSIPQDLTSLGGKVLRINPMTGGPAAGNPWLRSANPATRLIWTYGHRNPQGLALRPNGQMFSVEHGSYRDDEVNLLARGANYGWNPLGADGGYDETVPMTDLTRFPNARPAVWTSGPTTVATSGATFLSGRAWGAWNGSLIVAELKGQALLRLTLSPDGRQLTGQELMFAGTYGRLRTAQLGTDGSLYLTTGNGFGLDSILRVTPSRG